jgi:Carboxypeptidase regulatory-like domain
VGGVGRIRGELQLAAGLSPRPWRLDLRPSQVLIGRDQAISRTIEFSAEQREFDLSPLPLAGYDLIVAAAGASATPQPVLLVPGAEEVNVLLELYPAGNLSGSVIDPDGIGIVGLEVHLVSLPPALQRRTQTDPSGRFVIESLPDGQYELRLGQSAAPLVPPKSISFSASGMELEPQRLPRLFDLEILVTDSAGQAVEGAQVRGYSSAGGSIDVLTDSQGRARAHLLAPGRISLRSKVEGRGSAYTEVLIGADDAADAKANLVLAP